MKVQVIWENGVFRPTQRLNFRQSMMIIEVPDGEIGMNNDEADIPVISPQDIPIEVLALSRQMLAERDAIIKQPFQNTPESIATEDRERLTRAFHLRRELRRSQGRIS